MENKKVLVIGNAEGRKEEILEKIREGINGAEVEFIDGSDTENFKGLVSPQEDYSLDPFRGDTPFIIRNYNGYYENEYSSRIPKKDMGRAVIPVRNSETDPKIGRNDPCPCGSGKKWKKCCEPK